MYCLLRIAAVSLLCVTLSSVGAVAQTAFTNVDDRVAVQTTGLRLNRTTNTYDTVVSLTNTSAGTLTGPLALVVTQLSANASVQNLDGLMNGSPYLSLQVATGGLGPGQRLSGIALRFTNPTRTTIRFQLSVYSAAAQSPSEVPNEVARGHIDFAAGGILTVPAGAGGLGGARIVIPPGAALDDIDVQVGFESALPGPLSAAAVNAGAVQVSATVVLKVANGGKANFDKPVAITIPYDRGAAGNLPPAVFFWDPDTQRYRTVSVIQVDRINGLVTFQTSHFSSFVALVLKALGASMPSTDTGFRVGRARSCTATSAPTSSAATARRSRRCPPTTTVLGKPCRCTTCRRKA